ncbi:MAG: hypothetical protein B6D61_02875 [Bacteroidetes bacterium 4484_249]|nr:MAG: hypothetical protein B6D61_02875 [Bacteroidetes bacterium 4484_249]
MKKVVFISLIALSLTSCEKVIDFDLKNSEPQLVIEATTNGTTNIAEVKLSLSGDYYDSGDFEKISEADVTLILDNNNRFTLNEVTPGVFQNNDIRAEAGDMCNLEVSVRGKIYMAGSQMPATVFIDSVYYQYSPETLFAPEGYRVIVVFSDPPEKGNYYRILLEVDGDNATSGIYYLFSDESGTQGEVNYVLFRNALYSGNSFRVKLVTIDKTTYDYFSEIEKISGVNPGPALAAPANPHNNIEPEALGYFSAQNQDVSETIIIRTK